MRIASRNFPWRFITRVCRYWQTNMCASTIQKDFFGGGGVSDLFLIHLILIRKFNKFDHNTPP